MSQQTQHAQWVLDLVVEIDRYCPGLCGEFLRTSDERRQVVAAFLAAQPPAEDQMEKVGRFLLAAGHHSILRAAYEEVPKGFRGALRRAGSAVPKRPFFALLYRLLVAPPHDHVARCVANLERLDFARLLIVQMLPETLCRPNLVALLNKPSEAGDVITAMRFLTSRGVSKDALTQSIQQVDDATDLSRAFRKALLKAQAPEHPVPGSDSYSPICSGDELATVSREFRNCLRSYAIRFVDEASPYAFAVARDHTSKCVVHLMRDGDVWNLEELYGPRNERPPSALREWVKGYLAGHGVNVQDRFQRKSSDWDALRRLTDRYPEFD